MSNSNPTPFTLAVTLILSLAAVSSAQPTISNITPPLVAAGTATFTLDVYGTGFTDSILTFPGSAVTWNGTTSLPTTYLSPFHLRATVNYTLISNQGLMAVRVVNSSFSAEPGTSNPVLLNVGAPLPLGISHINPGTVVAGSGSFVLFVYGNGFRQGGGIPYIPPSVITWNGNPLTTTYVQLGPLGVPFLTTLVPASLLACAGTAQVRVQNPSPILPFGSTTYSNIVTFTITPAVSNPTISSLSPSSTVAGGPNLTLSVYGCNFAVTTTTFGPITIQNYPKILIDGVILTTAYVSPTELAAVIPASSLAVARTANLRVRNYLSQTTYAESPAVPFAVLPPVIGSLSPPSILPMTPATPPVQLVVAGSRFLPGAMIHADGIPLATTYVSASELRANVGPALVQTQRIGGVAINVANAIEAVSNTVPLVVGSGSNQGTIRRHPLNPSPGAPYSALIEGGFPGGVVTLVVDLANPLITNWPSPAINLVLAAGTPGSTIPLVDGFGLFSPATGTTLDAAGGLTVPGFVLPNPSIGLSVTVQAIYLDPAAPLGFTLTWPRFPDVL